MFHRKKKKNVLKAFAITVAIQTRGKKMPKNLLPIMPPGEIFFMLMPNASINFSFTIYGTASGSGSGS